LGQYQQVGSSFFNQLKNILISYIAAREVINGTMTLGMMMAVSYIVGQINSPVQSLLGFIQSAQDAKISLDRLGEIHNREDEEKPEQSLSLLGVREDGEMDYSDFISGEPVGENNNQPETGDIVLNNVSFQYTGPNSPFVL